MEKMRIYYSYKGNGIVFGTYEGDYKRLKSDFPNAQPARSITIEYDRQSNFKDYHPQLENYILPALTGFPKLEDLKQIKTVQFILTPEMVVTYTIEQNQIQNEQKVQPICG